MNLKEMIYTASIPYPEKQKVRPNKYYACEMLDNVGGCTSEMSTISLYLYNNLMTEEIDSNVAIIFE